MGGLLLLVVLCVVMAVASFFAGALPLSLSLSQPQLRLISSVGVGILVGSALIVIIPEGIEAIAYTGAQVASTPHSHGRRQAIIPAPAPPSRWDTRTLDKLVAGVPRVVTEKTGALGLRASDQPATLPLLSVRWSSQTAPQGGHNHDQSPPRRLEKNAPGPAAVTMEAPRQEGSKTPVSENVHLLKEDAKPHELPALPTFYIGFFLALGFVFMFLIDRVPRQAMDRFQAAPATRHISLDNLASSSVGGEDESEGFLGSMAPTPKQSRSLSTTTGLVIHAAADGIAMGASATTSNMKLGLVIFVAIMIHKAPAAFGLTSVLLKQGLSKRAARGHLIVFSLAAPVGALATYLIASLLGGKAMNGESGQWWTGMLLLFSAGTFLYVAMHAMQEESHATHEHHGGMNGYSENGSLSQKRQSRPQMRDTIATVVGMFLPLLTQFGHHH